jgi:hypothetical protein
MSAATRDLGQLMERNVSEVFGGAPPVLRGTDIAVFVSGKSRTLYTFIEMPDVG